MKTKVLMFLLTLSLGLVSCHNDDDIEPYKDMATKNAELLKYYMDTYNIHEATVTYFYGPYSTQDIYTYNIEIKDVYLYLRIKQVNSSDVDVVPLDQIKYFTFNSKSNSLHIYLNMVYNGL